MSISKHHIRVLSFFLHKPPFITIDCYYLPWLMPSIDILDVCAELHRSDYLFLYHPPESRYFAFKLTPSGVDLLRRKGIIGEKTPVQPV